MATQPSVTLSAPYKIFPLSLPLHQTRAKHREGSSYRVCHSAPVELRKRKRSKNNELATAIDGEGVNIYDVRSTKTVSSYALQPTTCFSCAPASSALKISKTETFRRTYASVISPKKELIVWEETVQTDVAAAPVRVTRRSMGSKENILYIQDLNTENGARSGLLAILADGHINFFSEDLQEQYWDFQVAKSIKKSVQVVYASTTTLSTARKALFKSRPGLELTAEGTADVAEEVVLLMITQIGTSIHARLLSIPTKNGSRRPREHVCLELPARQESLVESTFSVHFASGVLYHLLPDRLVSYSLCAEAIAAVTTLPIPPMKQPGVRTSLLRISSSTVLIATDQDISLYDTKFSSLQAQVSIAAMTNGNSNTTGSVFLTNYMQDLDLAVGYSQGGIMGIQFTRSRGVQRQRKSGLLIDSLCCGIRGLGIPEKQAANKPRKTGGLAEKLEKKKREAEETIVRLREAKENGDIHAFEDIFAGYVGLTLPPIKTDEDLTMTDGDDSASAIAISTRGSDCEIPKTSHKPLRTEFVSSVLSLIFSVVPAASPDDEDTMDVAFFSPIVLRYLLESGNFSTLHLPLKDRLVQVLITFDPTLRSLQWFLSSLSELSVTETMRAIEIAIFLPSPPRLGGDDIAIFEIHRTEVLRTALIRLAGFPTPIILSAFKALPSDTLLPLISLLEKELIAGEDVHYTPVCTIGIEDITIIAELLTAAVDAIGISGLLMQETSEILDTLSKDVEDALTVVKEAASLKGLLEEMFHHVNWKDLEATAAAESSISTASKVVPRIPKKTHLNAAEIEHKKAKARARAERRAERRAKATTGVPAPPSKSLVKSNSTPSGTKPVFIHKRRRALASAGAQAALLARINAKRKPVVGHKKMLRQSGVTRKELVRQDRPVAVGKRASPILQLGVVALRRIVDPNLEREVEKVLGGIQRMEGCEVGKGEKGVKKMVRMKREYWREGLAAGVYSVETMVV